MNAMQPTRIRLLLAIAVISAAVGWGLVQIVDSWAGRLVAVPWLAAGSLWLVAGSVAYWAWSTKPRLSGQPGTRPMDPIVAARSAALAMAASRIGALVFGLYGGIAVAMIGYLATASGVRTFWASVVASVGALALAAAALWLEHICRLPADPGDPPPGTSGQ